ncbi:hypothetical protein [Brevundimonas vesicularis]|uniref:hypothetical protein n=1 Tax=Brevundimonas vesicularis TaxID=41276 RepID=UPI0027D7F233|nr:hypothetical protein [Brevundimonas vesicularis]
MSISAVVHKATTRFTPSGEITATTCFPSGETSTEAIAGRRAKAVAAGGVAPDCCAFTVIGADTPLQTTAAITPPTAALNIDFIILTRKRAQPPRPETLLSKHLTTRLRKSVYATL